MPGNLRNVEEKNFLEKIDAWATAHANILLPLCLIILGILLIMVCYSIVGLSATDSGIYYNHLQGVI